MNAQPAQADRLYVVRLAVQTTAPDPTDAVQRARDQILRRGLENFTFSVDDVSGGAKFFVSPSPHPDPSTVIYPSWGDAGLADDARGADIDHDDDEDYRGQFLG